MTVSRLPVMRRIRRWYNRFGIEEPFPWLPFVVIGIVLAFFVAAICLGITAF